jgi:hypothetical protein
VRPYMSLACLGAISLGSLLSQGGCLPLEGCLPIGPFLPGGGSAARGQSLYSSLSCRSCHGAKACGGTGPNIRATTVERMGSFLRDANSPHLGRTYTDLSDRDISALVAYLNGLPPGECTETPLVPPAPPAKYVDFGWIATHDPGSGSFNTHCTFCHGNRENERAPHGTILAAHSAMSDFIGSDDPRCLNCHANGVDLVFGSTSRLRTQDYSVAAPCASRLCHGASGALPFYLVDQ